MEPAATSVMSDKTIVVWANCIGGSVIHALNRLDPGEWNAHWYQNFEFIQEEKDLPAALKSADIFLYQNYRPKPGTKYDLGFIKSEILNRNCTAISFPTLHSISLQFGHEYYEPNNNRTICPSFPHGQFMYGIKPVADEYCRLSSNVTSLAERTKIAGLVAESAMADSYIPPEMILEQQERSLGFLKEKALSSDIPTIYDFVSQNFADIRLWHNPFHPNGVLLDQMCRLIFECMGIPYTSNDSTVDFLDGLLKDWVMPILPSTQAYYGMAFPDYCYSKYHPDIIDSRSYLSAYLNALYVPIVNN